MPRPRKEKRGSRKRDVVLHTPPPVPIMGRGSMTLRFQKLTGSSATTDNIPWKAFCNVWYMGTAANAGRPLFDAIKVREVQLWSPAVVMTSATGYISPPLQLQVKFAFLDTGTTSSPIDCTRTYTDVPTNQRGATIRYKTQKGTPYRAWINVNQANANAGSPNLFGINAPIGSIIDVKLSYQLAGNIQAAMNALVTSGTATIGALYWNYLDSVTSTGSAGSGNWANVASSGNTSLIAV